MKNILKLFSLLLMITGISGLSSCEKTWDEPDISCSASGVTPNATISDILNLSPGGEIIQIEDDLIMEGFVISSDEAGNYYKTLVLQDAPENPTAGIMIVLDKRNLYVDYPVGKKVYVKTKGLFIGKDRGVYKLGLTYDTDYGTSIGRIPPSEVKWRVLASCDQPVSVTPQIVTIEDIQTNGDNYVHTLIQLNNVQFQKSDLCSTYSVPGTNGENKYLEDCNGNSLVMRNSGYADFAETVIPSGNGTVVGVLGKYNRTFQVYIRDLNDVQMDGTRCDGTEVTCDATALTPNATIAELKNALGENDLLQITEDWIIEAVVTATDKSGNLYKAVYIEDETGGIRLNINLRDLYLRGYHRGAKLRIKLKDLYIGKRSGEIQLGDIYRGSIGRITDDIDQDHIFFLNETVDVQPVDVSITSLTHADLGKLIRINNVKFIDSDVAEFFALTAENSSRGNPAAGNRMLRACDNSGEITVRTSGYANFAAAHVRYGTGSITGILSCYDRNRDGEITNDEYQIYLRDIYDVEMEQARCDAPILLETFGLTEKNTEIDLLGWYNYAEAGTRKWTGGFWDGNINHYAQMSAYRSNEAQNIAWLISPPIAVTAGMTLSFQSSQAYWRHDGLQVFVSTDFNGFNVRNATWTELEARIATESDPFYKWIDSGEIDLSAYAGQIIYIGFRYKGSGEYGETTTYRIDNVIIQ